MKALVDFFRLNRKKLCGYVNISPLFVLMLPCNLSAAAKADKSDRNRPSSLTGRWFELILIKVQLCLII